MASQILRSSSQVSIPKGMLSSEDACDMSTPFPTISNVCLVVQVHTEEAIIDRQPNAFVINKAKLLELVHEMANPGPGSFMHSDKTLALAVPVKE